MNSICRFILSFFVLGSLFIPSLSHASYLDTLSAMACVDTHIQLLRDKDFEQAYYKCCSQEYREVVNLIEFQKFVNQFEPLADNRSLELGKIGFNKEGHGLYQGIVSSNEGERLLIRYQLVREHGRWKIHNISLFNPSSEQGVENIAEQRKQRYSKYPNPRHR